MDAPIAGLIVVAIGAAAFIVSACVAARFRIGLFSVAKTPAVCPTSTA